MTGNHGSKTPLTLIAAQTDPAQLQVADPFILKPGHHLPSPLAIGEEEDG